MRDAGYAMWDGDVDRARRSAGGMADVIALDRTQPRYGERGLHRFPLPYRRRCVNAAPLIAPPWARTRAPRTRERSLHPPITHPASLRRAVTAGGGDVLGGIDVVAEARHLSAAVERPEM